MVSSREPLGSATDVLSPALRPSSAVATGDSAERRPSAGLASWELTIFHVCSTPFWSRTCTEEPKLTFPPEPTGAASTITAALIRSRSLAIFVSRWAWSFLAS